MTDILTKPVLTRYWIDPNNQEGQMKRCFPAVSVFPKCIVLGNIGTIALSIIIKFISEETKATLCTTEFHHSINQRLPKVTDRKGEIFECRVEFDLQLMNTFWAIQDTLKASIPINTFDLDHKQLFPSYDQETISNDIFEQLIKLQER
jgi:hypothetical protein